ncbi:MAG: TlpA family protein disulfide reductase [Acidimicrobiia bacterium]|nr:TlpA family protein disulfide reductase [Acidimicrobiia bacterium]
MTSAPPDSPPSEPEPPSQPGGDGTNSPLSTGPLRPTSAVLTTVVIVVAVATLGLLALFSGTEDTIDEATSAGGAGGILELAFTTGDGGSGSLSDYGGRPLVVNFFASWCPPCRAELPDFETVHQELGDRVTFVGVNQDFTEATWRAFVAESKVSYDTVFQPNSDIWNELGTGAMPTTAFISPDGEVVHLWAGLLTDDKLIELIDEHLVEKS